MQVSCEPASLLFLNFEQAPRQGAQPLVRMLELPVHPLERLLRFQALRDVVDDDEACPATAPTDQMSHAVDIDRLAVLARVAKNAAVHGTAGLVPQEIAPLIRAPQVSRAHVEEFLPRVA